MMWPTLATNSTPHPGTEYQFFKLTMAPLIHHQSIRIEPVMAVGMLDMGMLQMAALLVQRADILVSAVCLRKTRCARNVLLTTSALRPASE